MSLKTAVSLFQTPSYAGWRCCLLWCGGGCAHRALPVPDLPSVAQSSSQVTWIKPQHLWWGWLTEARHKGPPSNASLVLHGISTWNILSVTGILLKRILRRQLRPCGRPLPLQPEALESKHCSASYPKTLNNICKAASSSIVQRSCPDFSRAVVRMNQKKWTCL